MTTLPALVEPETDKSDSPNTLSPRDVLKMAVRSRGLDESRMTLSESESLGAIPLGSVTLTEVICLELEKHGFGIERGLGGCSLAIVDPRHKGIDPGNRRNEIVFQIKSGDPVPEVNFSIFAHWPSLDPKQGIRLMVDFDQKKYQGEVQRKELMEALWPHLQGAPEAKRVAPDKPGHVEISLADLGLDLISLKELFETTYQAHPKLLQMARCISGCSPFKPAPYGETAFVRRSEDEFKILRGWWQQNRDDRNARHGPKPPVMTY